MTPRLKTRLKRLRRRVAETIGIERYSRPALHDLDRKLARVVGDAPGFFIEAGANDGFTQSNTYYLERIRGWQGILIEPIPELCARCRRERPRSVVVQAALVAPDFPQGEIEMSYAGLMSVSAGAFGDATARQRHVEIGLQQHDVGAGYTVRVPARTLSSIIEAEARGREVDLLSLDVEGAELSALAGLELPRHAPRWICVEARDIQAVTTVLGSWYQPPEVLSDNGTHRDLLFRRR
jgi:FkbM family methyltransferase